MENYSFTDFANAVVLTAGTGDSLTNLNIGDGLSRIFNDDVMIRMSICWSIS